MKMKKISLLLVSNVLVFIGITQTKYDHRKAFDPNFYPQTGNDYRSASGEPGPKHWQNKADYKINVSLDTVTHKVTGEVEITYTNNSPDNLKFLWLQLDQNIINNLHVGQLLLLKQVDDGLMQNLPKEKLLNLFLQRWRVKNLHLNF